MPNIQFQFRRGTSTEWADANPILASGEMGIETNTNLFKIGNGVTPWNSLPYGGIQGATGAGISGYSGISVIQVIVVSAAYRDWETDRKSTRLKSSHRL